MSNIFGSPKSSSGSSYYPPRLDDNIIRAVASITFMIALIMQLRPGLKFLVIPLFADFVLRYIHPKFSPLARLNKIVCHNFVQKTPEMVWAPPKRFAMLIGLVMTGFMTVAYFLNLIVIFQILLIFLLIASGLQAWYDYCLGCQLYDQLIKIGLLGRGQTVQSFSTYLKSIKGESVPNRNMTARDRVEASLTAEAIADGVITQDESRLIESITTDLHRYDGLLTQAQEDGLISGDERRKLWHDRQAISRRARIVAEQDQVITDDEARLLSKLHSILHTETLYAEQKDT